MKKILVVVFIGITLLGCSKENPSKFSTEALEDVLLSLDGKEVLFKDILEKHKGKKVLIDIWASWCPDCLKSIPEVQKIQGEQPETAYIFLSLDRNKTDWKNGIERLKIEGDHYFIESGWEGNLGEFLGLDWIPRFLVIDEKGKILVFDATKATDNFIRQSLEKM
ncbi:TlpA family protein disulfide reductase [Tenacibaculum sp. 1B UA]|uniref:TlpA family protein disulfide reductase n=1 Tax=unclassified Tenacibaculum TaxID=2635139 RepID=UPI0026E20739|nr:MULTISPECIES: TlpA disulfide reductase family protein [unclassified Tenacibaculum]MDO6675495.1 TlpA disulfide reductase family protein [Tenacibaculum sp. 1_MG-2023]MDX8552828.1 TlpA family protein disulfide reductase [Tenacibaculum sp. 1B UA]